ncbi:MAG: hypothetical protein AAB870_04810 [Patescibacteria group bacterium]
MKIDFISDINKGYATALNYSKADRFMMKVLWWHLGIFLAIVVINSVLKLAEIYPSPLSWRVISITEGVVAAIIAILTTLIPFFLKPTIKNHYVWRVIITTALVVYAYLLVFISGGAIEMHFHFFIIAALLVIYADWRLGWILLVLTGLHHGILNYFEPGWVYFYGKNDLSVMWHALPVLVTVIFTTQLSETSRNSVIDLDSAKHGLEKQVKDRTKALEVANNSLEAQVKKRTNELEQLKNNLEKEVTNRTQELNEKLSEVKRLNELMVGREIKMADLKNQLGKAKKNGA